MNNTTRLYSQLRNYLSNSEIPRMYFDKIYDKFEGVFERKEIEEYKNMGPDKYPPQQFSHLVMSMKQSFVEGYLLAQMEQSRSDIKALYTKYKQEVQCPPTKADAKISS